MMIDDDFPVDPFSSAGSTTWSAESFISCDISEKSLGVGQPDMLAEVETTGRPKRRTISMQKSIMGILIPTDPSSATVLYARE